MGGGPCYVELMIDRWNRGGKEKKVYVCRKMHEMVEYICACMCVCGGVCVGKPISREEGESRVTETTMMKEYRRMKKRESNGSEGR